MQLGVGSTVVRIGQTGCVPLHLFSSVALSNLSWWLDHPPDRFAHWTFVPTNLVVGPATVQTLDPTHTAFSLGVPSGQVLQGPVLVGTICFEAVLNSSAFVPLIVTHVQGAKSDGTSVGNIFGLPGRVVVIGREPLLEASLF